ncbi:hypothetical protein GCM10009069_02440 [Algimonas arctica]|uniref:DUF2157 domain-containing protein n=1 Tax=Algimonas arctica TaxID=1479486 RepID=A0A8J3CKM8_9PROT|nr:DUF2157 domain-containing protein [Algimonas arctica]GHA82753.1 hypothetical protein GCM10009069_02440 [Algimonas arctica]
MELAGSHYFTEIRDTQAWRSRGLLALYCFGVASLIAAIVTFIAHNWTYLGTGMKLGGLGAALIICAGLWVIKGFDRPSAQSFGIAVQVLIGVWLAAAGQLYQAPGGLQDLLLTWAVLGVPFVLVSRSAPHWAVWFGVIWLAAISPMGLEVLAAVGPDCLDAIWLAGAVILGAGVMGSLYKRSPVWLSALLAIGLGILCIGASWLGLFDAKRLGQFGPSLIALVLLGVTGWRSYALKVASPTAIIASAVAIVCVSIFGELISGVFDEPVLFFFLMTGLVCAATFGLVVFFKHLRVFIDADEPDTDGADTDPWYMDALIGAGGVLTAGFACGLIGAVIGLSGLMESNWGVSLSIIGAGVYALSIAIRQRQPGQFIRFMFGTFILAWMSCLALGLGEAASETFVAGLVLLGLSIVTVWLVSGDRILSALMAVSACIGMAFIITELLGQSWDVAVLMCVYTVLGLVFSTVLLRGRVHIHLTAVFLIAAIATGLIAGMDMGHLADSSWTLIDIVNGLLAAAGGAWLWLRYVRSTGLTWPIFVVLIVIAIILPTGAVPAMLLLMLAYSIGSRALFLIGVIAMAWFLFSAYFDLSMTLIALSGIMATVGVGLLGIWAFASKRVEIAS